MNAITPLHPEVKTSSEREFTQLVTFYLGAQLFGISALQVRDILRQQPLTPVPLNPPEIAGTMNLRGHIVTAINLRARLGIFDDLDASSSMCVVVEARDEQFSLIVDRVGDVLATNTGDVGPNPSSFSADWAEFSRGIVQLPNDLLIVLDIEKLLTL